MTAFDCAFLDIHTDCDAHADRCTGRNGVSHGDPRGRHDCRKNMNEV
jgi:hypothetical protein